MFNILVQPDYVAINHCSFLQNGLQSLYASSKHIRQRFVRIIIFSTAAHLHMRGISCPYQEKKQGNINYKTRGGCRGRKKGPYPSPIILNSFPCPCQKLYACFCTCHLWLRIWCRLIVLRPQNSNLLKLYFSGRCWGRKSLWSSCERFDFWGRIWHKG